MKTFATTLLLWILPAMALGAEAIIAPPWAYHPAADPDFRPPTDTDVLHHVPGSDKAFTRAGIGDWFPGDHPVMPDIVAHGRAPGATACAICHLPNGLGHPESADLAGEPAAYFIQQMKDMQSGKRKNIVPTRSAGMVKIALAMTDDEIKATAVYFAMLKPMPWVTVKETDTAPVTYIGLANMRFVKPGGGTEALGERIIEVPEDSELAGLRDPRSPFIAYAPIGSLKKGEALVTAGGNGKTTACAGCHGAELKGSGDVPRIAGLHPVYIVRQLLDIQQGSRDGAGAQTMKAVVAKLTPGDIVDIAAYAASRTP